MDLISTFQAMQYIQSHCTDSTMVFCSNPFEFY
jgi:hypothetical protein